VLALKFCYKKAPLVNMDYSLSMEDPEKLTEPISEIQYSIRIETRSWLAEIEVTKSKRLLVAVFTVFFLALFVQNAVAL